MSDTPKEIWLTKDDDQSYLWSQDKIDTGDIAYTRDDIVEQKLATMRGLIKDIIADHKNDNDCYENPCQWCHEAYEVLESDK